MSEKQISIRTFIEKFNRGEFNVIDVDVQCDAGWYDWFCKDSSLARKTKVLGSKLKQIIGSKKIDIDKTYVLFKNNCPVHGTLYDDFRICDLETGDAVYTIVPRSGHKVDKGKGEIWGKENDFEGPLFVGTWKDIKKWFLGDD